MHRKKNTLGGAYAPPTGLMNGFLLSFDIDQFKKYKYAKN